MNEYETLKTCVAEQWRNFKNFYTLEKNMQARKHKFLNRLIK